MEADEEQTVERFKATAAYIGEKIEEQEQALLDLAPEERDEFAAQLNWRRRELQDIRERIAQVEEDLFARDVLRDLKQL